MSSSPIPAPSVRAKVIQVRDGAARETTRVLPEETAVALVYDAAVEAVMMATPADLEDFALGFSLNEGVIRHPSDIRELEIAPQAEGIELRIWLHAEASRALGQRRRLRAGPTGCGLCGMESLEAAVRRPPRVESRAEVEAEALIGGVRDLAGRQSLNHATRAVHAAALFVPGHGVVAVREDVGRHNALDKLAGALARDVHAASRGAVLLTSRVSVELVQKAAAMGAPILAAVSAPTALALRTAEGIGMTIVGIVRDDGLEVFTHPERIADSAADGRQRRRGA